MSASFNSISALLPVKNGQDFLIHLVPLILSMLSENDDLIVVNDGSIDSSGTIIENFSNYDNRIKILNTSGIGLVKSLNLGVRASDKEWIARFDVDDSYSVKRLSYQRELIDDDVSVIFSDYKITTAKRFYLGRIYSAVYPQMSALALITSQRSAHPVAVFNRNKFLECGGYDESDFPVEDLALWLKMSKIGRIVSTPCAVLSYRLSPNSISGRNRKIQKLKTLELIRSFDKWDKWLKESLFNFEDSIALYKSIPNSSHRIFLHLRDLFWAARVTGLKFSKFKILRRLDFFLCVKMLVVGISFSYFALLRNFYRIIKKIPQLINNFRKYKPN